MDKDFLKVVKAFLLKGVDEEKIAQEVNALREEFPAHSSYELAGILVRRTAIISSVSGGIVGAVPWPFTMLLAFPDLIMLLLMQSNMILKLAVLADKDPSDDTRVTEILGCLGASSGAIAGTLGIRKLIDSGLVFKVLPMILKNIIGSYAKVSFSKAIPFLGTIAGGSLNFGTTMAVGNFAKDYYFPIKLDIPSPTGHYDDLNFEDYEDYEDFGYDDYDGDEGEPLKKEENQEEEPLDAPEESEKEPENSDEEDLKKIKKEKKKQ